MPNRLSSYDLIFIPYSPIRVDTEGAALQAHWQQTYTKEASTVEAILPSDIPAGFYILQATDEQGLSQELFINLTRNTLLLSETPRQLSAWVSDMSGESVPNALIQIYDQNKQKISEGRADANGVYSLALPTDSPRPALVIAFSGKTINNAEHAETDITISGINLNWRDRKNWWGWWQLPPPPPQFIAGNLYTDRPIYQPGQRVYFKTILRADDDAILSLLPAGTPVRLQVNDPRTNPVNVITATLNQYGTAAAFIDIAEGAALGLWQITAQIGDDQITQSFQVEQYIKPQFSLQISQTQQTAVAGQPITLSVAAEYYFGQPVANATLSANVYYNHPYYDFYQEKTIEYWYPSEFNDLELGKTNPDGTLSTALTIPESIFQSGDDDTNGWIQIGIETTAQDADGQSLSTLLPLKIWRRAEQIDLKTPNIIQRGQPLNIQAHLHDINGNPIAGRELILSLRRWNGETYAYDQIVSQAWQISDAQGNLTFTLPAAQAGRYELHLRGRTADNQIIATYEWLYIPSASTPVDETNSSAFSLSAERDTYAPGETATLYIYSNTRGSALLAFERGTTRRTQIVNLTPPRTQIQVLILPEDSPNIFVSVYHWKANDTRILEPKNESDSWLLNFAPNESLLLNATLQLRVPATDKQLQINLIPQQRISTPRTNLPLRIEVRDANGQPTAAELSLALVDESIFALSNDHSEPLYQSFYGARQHQIVNYHSMANQRATNSGDFGGGGGGDDRGPGMTPRQNFPDTALWLPQLRTDESGVLTVTLPLPDNLTEWRVTVKAVTLRHQVGEASTSIITQQPLVIRPAFPQTLVQGDTAPLTAFVHNYTQQTQQIRVSLIYSPTDALQIQTSPIQTMTLPPGSVQALGWEAQTLRAAPLQVELRAGAAGDLADSVSVALPIEPRAVPQIDHQTGQLLNGSAQTILVIPNDTLSGTLAIKLSLSEAGTLLDGLEYLTGYPYGCVEQTMSRALPNAVIGRAFLQLGYEPPNDDLNDKINAGLQRLYGFQHNDGGWGWWLDDETNDYQTAWVLFGLSATAEAGYPVAPQVTERAAEWLIKHLEQTQIDDATRAFSLFSLAYAKQPLRAQILQLAERAAELDPFSQAALALALHRVDESAQAQRLLRLLEDSAQHTPEGQTYWQMPPSADAYRAKTMASTLRTTAWVLSAFAQIEPSNPISDSIAAWLMAHKRPQGWGNTNETAFSILGLTDYLLAKQRDLPDSVQAQIRVDDQRLATVTLTPQQPQQVIRIPVNQLPQGASILSLQSTPPRTLYYQVHNQLYFNQTPIPAAGNIQISRAYTDPKTNQPITSVRVGQIVRVTLTIKTPMSGMYILLEDHLPGGLEAINERLNITSATYYDPSFYDYPSDSHWQEYGYNYKEIRGARVTFFITNLPAGGKVITYLVRAVHPGTFTALPAECYAMYDETLWGRSESSVLGIQAIAR